MILQKHCLINRRALVFIRCFSATSICNLNQKWREDKGLPMNPNAYGPLTDKPDYSFLDGRPTPLGSNQKQRMLQQRDIAEQIITLTQEMDFAVERHNQMKIETQNNKKRILDNKLKPKGELLRKNGSKQ